MIIVYTFYTCMLQKFCMSHFYVYVKRAFGSTRYDNEHDVKLLFSDRRVKIIYIKTVCRLYMFSHRVSNQIVW